MKKEELYEKVFGTTKPEYMAELEKNILDVCLTVINEEVSRVLESQIAEQQKNGKESPIEIFEHTGYEQPKDKHDMSLKLYDYWDMIGFAEMCVNGKESSPQTLEPKEEFKPCGEGDNICNCKSAKECGYVENIKG